jgi:four helix bundle protein
MSYKHEDLKARTKAFAIRIVKLVRMLPKTEDARIMGRQLMRAGTGVAANYRAVCRARSKAEFIAKVGVVVEEADESVFWLEMLVETDLVSAKRSLEGSKRVVSHLRRIPTNSQACQETMNQ